MDAETYRQLVLRHKDRVNAYAAWMLGNRDDGVDIAQEALIRMWTHRSKVRPEASLSWLLKTTYRLCIDRTRRRKVRGEIGGDVLDPMPTDTPSPERMTFSGQIGAMLEGALSNLTPTDRAAVLLREVQGMTYDEIATTLDLPLGTVKAKLHRSRERLRQDLVGAGVTP